MRLDLWLVLLAIPLSLVAAGCGDSLSHDPGPSPTTIHADFRGSPPALVAVHDQADELLGGGVRAFRARMRALRGHPVVVNLWASWCEPCQSEFPIFQQAAARYGRRIAFLGVDVADQRGSAAAFLKRFPVTYPSYSDPDRAIEGSLLTLAATPQTFFYDAQGREQGDNAGSYASAAGLAQDIRTYLGIS